MTFILKPENGAQGRGIYLTRSLKVHCMPQSEGTLHAASCHCLSVTKEVTSVSFVHLQEQRMSAALHWNPLCVCVHACTHVWCVCVCVCVLPNIHVNMYMLFHSVCTHCIVCLGCKAGRAHDLPTVHLQGGCSLHCGYRASHLHAHECNCITHVHALPTTSLS